MQINNKIGWGIRIIFSWMIFSLHACCNDKEENEVIPICIASNHSLMALVPDFSIQTVGNTLHTKQITTLRHYKTMLRYKFSII